ncbi:hypothetical protein MYU51_014217 [Penicillium brevicompactum]
MDVAMNDTHVEPNQRKRAAVACEYCRKRKRRCDGKRPICSLCLQANRADCCYSGLESFLHQADTLAGEYNERNSPGLLSDRIERHDEVIGEHTAAIDIMRSQIAQLIGDAAVSSQGEIFNTPLPQHDNLTPQNQSGFLLREFTLSDAHDTLPMNIYAGHLSTTENLLQTEKAKVLLGNYPVDLFLRTERKRGQSEDFRLDARLSTRPPFGISENPMIEELVHEYFKDLNPTTPIIDADSFWELFASLKNRPGDPGVKEALIFVMCALVQVNRTLPNEIKSGELPGKTGFFFGLEILMREWATSFHTDLHLCQALFLAASCDMLAEYQLPRSGIELMVEKLFYPNAASYSTDAYLIWIANLSARRLMNRVHFTTYKFNGNSLDSNYTVDQIFDKFIESSGSANALFTTSAELYSQLKQWWDLLPPSIKPRIDDVNPTTQEGVLLLRFWAYSTMVDSLIEPAVKCIYHCRKFLEVADSVTKVPSIFTMINMHS